jgi:hypothetical protein
MKSTSFCQLSTDELLELACEHNGDTVQTVDALIGGVLARYAHLMDDAAVAALNAVRGYHVPQLAEALADLEAVHRAN